MCVGAESVERRELVRETPRNSRFAVDAPSCEKHKGGALRTDQARQGMRQAEAGVDSDLHEITGETASGAATRKSATRARPSPPPIAAPWIAATTGFVARNSRTASRYNGLLPEAVWL